ncbi:unnamed protein product [Closterium sp. NIES-65]|nr:unnamed protein product [Closterium sp. NIES-65]
MDLRETVSLPLPPSLRSRLLAAGFLTVADFHTLKPEDLARDASLSLEDAKHVLGVAAGSIQTSIIPTAAGIAGICICGCGSPIRVGAFRGGEGQREGADETMCAEVVTASASRPVHPFVFRSPIRVGAARSREGQREGADHVCRRALNGALYARMCLYCIRAGARSAWELLEAERGRGRVQTMCAELDAMLGGGVALQELTELCGPPGVGKTQLGMQLAINVQTPAVLRGVEGEAVYVDTEGSFMVERAAEMADAWAAHCTAAATAIDAPTPDTTAPSQASIHHQQFQPHQQHSQQQFQQQHQQSHNRSQQQQHMFPNAPGAVSAAVASKASRAAALAGVHYLRVYDHTEQTALVHSLPHLLALHPKVKLVVIDSVTFHFRHGFTDMGLRSRLLASMARELLAIADEHNVAVVLVNQVTTKVEGEVSRLVPALGESWAHACTNRVILFWSGGQRFAHLFKSPYLRAGTAPFTVTSEGVRSLQDAHKRQRVEGSERGVLLQGPGGH